MSPRHPTKPLLPAPRGSGGAGVAAGLFVAASLVLLVWTGTWSASHRRTRGGHRGHQSVERPGAGRIYERFRAWVRGEDQAAAEGAGDDRDGSDGRRGGGRGAANEGSGAGPGAGGGAW